MAEIGKDLKKARQLLEQGSLVAIPTETVYGLAGNALSSAAVASIFKVKNRPQFDPLIVHIPDLESAKKYVIEIPGEAQELSQKFWPGPLTLLLKRKPVIPDLVTSGLDTVGIRCPDHSLTRQLLNELDFPLAAPSANPFGYVSPVTPEHVQEQLGRDIEYILDGGPCTIGIESTIIGFDQNSPVIYRLGGLSVEAIESTVGKVSVQLHSASNPMAPGQLKSHYAPKKKLILGNIDKLTIKHFHEKVGVLSFQQEYPEFHQQVLSQRGDLDEAAQNLFNALRVLDKLPIDLIIAELVPDTGLGRAINDRLKRAAAQ
ncbi:MAG: threonylcarbamoyl-AMP synthase [Flammeovirgaceae bacterium]|nr:threonylcarbamoyl-AMP synthase [Flammeovirgaceae bacterium]